MRAVLVSLDLTHWNTRAESLALGAVVFLAMVFAFFLKKRLFGKAISFPDVAIPLIFLTPAQYETFFRNTVSCSRIVSPAAEHFVLHGLAYKERSDQVRLSCKSEFSFNLRWIWGCSWRQ
jgi:hypothetical protein